MPPGCGIAPIDANLKKRPNCKKHLSSGVFSPFEHVNIPAVSQLKRGITQVLAEALTSSPVVVLEGARACGKSTVCRMIGAQNNWPPAIDLSSPQTLAQLKIDPLRYLRSLPSPAFIDEAQLAPDLPLWVKSIVDERARPGQFLLTGSARLGRSQLGGSDPLAGRSASFRMWGLTESERAKQLTPLAARLFLDEPFAPGRKKKVKAQPRPRWFSGGLPGIPGVLRDASWSVWERAIATYVESVIPLGAATSRVDHSRLARAFRYVAASSGQLLNIARMASELEIKADTARSYLEQLENCFLVFRVEAERPSAHKILTSHPRVFTTDVGLATWAMGFAETLPNPVALGSLMETRIAVALAASADWAGQRIVVRHWRDQRSKREVDLLLVHPNGKRVAIEVKASTVAGPSDVVGLMAYAMENRESLHAAYLIYEGDNVVDLTPSALPGGSIMAIPSSLLLSSAE